VLITGASGLIGRRLTEFLLQKGCRVSHLGRNQAGQDIPHFQWDPELGKMDHQALQGVDAIIHLAGAGIADRRWTSRRKREILDSRVLSTRLLFETLKTVPHKVEAVINASAVGFYGLRADDAVMTEERKPGHDFLADVVQQWEAEADRIVSLGIRVVKIRTGIVLSREGGALKEIMKPVQWGLGAVLGTGEQYMSWIHRDDLCGIFAKAIEDKSIHGAYNAVAPSPITNRTFTYSIARVLRRRILLPSVPAWVLKIMLGEMADMVLLGNKVSNEKVSNAGYAFQYSHLDEALRELLS